MTTSVQPTPMIGVNLPAQATPPQELRRIVVASLVGTALEWYDFFIYGMASALVFAELFFPVGDPAVNVLVSLATFGVAFLFRPLGGFLFGRLGDRIGRRSTLVLTTLLMGFSTGGIGQGLGAGAEFGGASTLLAEHAPAGRRGFYASFVQTGVQLGLLAGTLSFLLVGWLDRDDLLAWGWRIPFLISFMMIFVSLYFRLRIAESPVFRAMERDRTVVARPVRSVLRHSRRQFLVGVGAHVGDTAAVYIYTTFLLLYLPKMMEDGRAVALTAMVLFGLVIIALQPVYGALSDRIGRRPLNLFGTVFTALFAYPLFLLLETRQPVLITLGLIVATAAGFAPVVAVQPAFYAELFGAGVRYTGFAASREVGAAVSGFSPLVAAALLSAAGGQPWLVAGWLVVTSLVSVVAFAYSRETRDVDIAVSHGPPGPPSSSDVDRMVERSG
jgi:MHS family shikimate/dehydroshikimate transporter-like MFS transporter